MYIITINNVIAHISENVERNGNATIDVNGSIYFYDDIYDCYEVDSVPSLVENIKYCYTEADGFYINPNWVEPDETNTYGIPDVTYHAIINDLTSEVANSGY